jgi:hypothetical protein
MVIAQSTPPVNDKDAPYLVVFTTGDSTPQDKWLELAVQDPRDQIMSDITRACRVRVVNSKNPSSVYRTRYEQAIERSRLPAIVFTQADGGVLYVADRTCLPPNENALAREIQFFAEAAEKAQPLNGPWVNSNERGIMQYSQDCPDGVCPVPVAPNDSQAEQRKPLFPRLRNSGESSRNIMDNWFSTNNIGIHPTTFVVILGLILVILFMRGSDNGRA